MTTEIENIRLKEALSDLINATKKYKVGVARETLWLTENKVYRKAEAALSEKKD